MSPRKWEADVEVDECPVCRGVWLDAGELTRIQKSVQRPHVPESDPADAAARRALRPMVEPREGRICPKCATPLSREE